MSTFETLAITGVLFIILMLAIIYGQGTLLSLNNMKNINTLEKDLNILVNAMANLKSCSDNCTLRVSFTERIEINKTNETCIISNGIVNKTCFIPFNETFYVNGTVIDFYLNNTKLGVAFVE